MRHVANAGQGVRRRRSTEASEASDFYFRVSVSLRAVTESVTRVGASAA